MRLWHFQMIPILPRQQLLELHRECCGLRGRSWGLKHPLINYVSLHGWEHLYHYHTLVMVEMKAREYKPNPTWNDYYYRGKRSPPINPEWITKTGRRVSYPEHNQSYKLQCVKNLSCKLRNAPARRYNENEVYRFYAWIEENNLSVE